MGSFSVNCSLTNVSFHEGDRAVLIPLIPTSGIDSAPLLLTNKSRLDSPTENFTPFSLPIFGEYNDYGELENIRKDENTALIEAFFGIDIETFVSVLSSSLSFGMRQNILTKAYGIEGLDIVFVEDDTFLKMGLEEVGEHVYLHQATNLYIDIQTVEGNDQFFIKRTLGDTNEDALASGPIQVYLDGFLESFYALTGHMLHIRPESREKANLLHRLSGMYVHENAYDLLTGDGRNLSTRPFDLLRDMFRQWREENDDRRDGTHPLTRRFGFMDVSPNLKDVFKHPYFLDLYPVDTFLNDVLQKEFSTFYLFDVNIYGYSRFYFPSFCGPQYGNPKNEKALIELSHSLNERLYERMTEDEATYG